MKTMVTFLTVFVGALILVMVNAGLTCAQQTPMAVAHAGAAVDSVVGTGGHVPAQLVRGRGGGGRAFRGGRGFHGGGRGFRFAHRGPFFSGGVVPYSYYGDDYYGYGCGEGCYQEGDRTCVWNGYKYRCYITPSY
ncbi:MAG: hypothetical protein WBG50_01085 [Desulfomonilaceae bacterium]